MPDDGFDFRQIASDHFRILREGGDDDAFAVEDPHEAARGQMVDADRVLEFRNPRADDQDGLQFPGGIPDRAREGKDPFHGVPAENGVAHRGRLTGEDFVEIGAVGAAETNAGSRADVLAVGGCDRDVGDEARQLRLQPRQQHIVRRRVGGRDADGPAQPEREVCKIAEMVVDLSGDDTGLAVGALERLGLGRAVLDPQRDADQDQERNCGRRHEPEQL